MKYNLRKKHSLFELLSTQIKVFIGICISGAVILTGYIFRDNLLIMWETFIKIISNTSTYVFIGQFVLIPISLVGLLYFAVDYGISLLRNRFIPLDKDELEANNIHNYDEYNEFLIRFLRGYYPLKKLRRDIENSALKYLWNDEYLLRDNYLDASLLYWHKNSQQHKNKIILLSVTIGLFIIGILLTMVPFSILWEYLKTIFLCVGMIVIIVRMIIYFSEQIYLDGL